MIPADVVNDIGTKLEAKIKGFFRRKSSNDQGAVTPASGQGTGTSAAPTKPATTGTATAPDATTGAVPTTTSTEPGAAGAAGGVSISRSVTPMYPRVHPQVSFSSTGGSACPVRLSACPRVRAAFDRHEPCHFLLTSSE